MAQPAPARKPTAAGPNLVSRLAQWFTERLDRSGFAAIPRTGLTNGPRKLEPVQFVIYLNIFNRTIGAFEADRPEWARLTHEELATLAHCDVRSITKAMDVLVANPDKPKALNVLESRRAGRYIEYRVLDYTLATLPDRPLRTLNRAEEDREKEVSASPQRPYYLRGGQRWKQKFPEPVQIGGIEYRHEGPKHDGIEVSHQLRNGAVQILTRSRGGEDAGHPNNHGTPVPSSRGSEPGGESGQESGQERGTPVPSSRGSESRDLKSGGESGQERGTPVPSSEAAHALESALTPLFAELFQSKPSARLLAKIQTNLQSAPPAFLLQRIQTKRNSGYKVQEGLLPALAADAAEAWTGLPEPVRARYLPAPLETSLAAGSAAPTFLAESLDSGSEWSRIRRELLSTGVIAQQEFDNWFLLTAFAGFGKRGALKGVLAVHVPDRVTGEYLEQEHAARIIAAALPIGIEVAGLRFLPPESDQDESSSGGGA